MVWKKCFHTMEDFHAPPFAKASGDKAGKRVWGLYFFRGMGGWNFFIHASWKIIMT